MNRQIITKKDIQKAKQRKRNNENKSPEIIEEILDVSDEMKVDTYMSKLMKLIPAESIAVYLTLDGIIRSFSDQNSVMILLWAALAVGLIGTPLYLWRFYKIKKISQILISTFAFCIWIFAIGGVFEFCNWYESYYGALLLVVFTFFSPIFLDKNTSIKK